MEAGIVSLGIALMITILPIYGLIYLGIRRERLEYQRLSRDAVRALLIVGNSRGRRGGGGL